MNLFVMIELVSHNCPELYVENDFSGHQHRNQHQQAAQHLQASCSDGVSPGKQVS
jgi:hypothetical protein